MTKVDIKPGYIDIYSRSQQDISRCYQERTNRAYIELQKQVQVLLNENHQILKEAKSKNNY